MKHHFLRQIRIGSPKALAICIILLGTLFCFNTSANADQWNNILSSHTIYALAIDPETPEILYAAASGDGIYKSSNSGSTWSSVTNGLTDLYVQALVIGETTLYTGTYASGVFKSTDSGSTWSATGLTDRNIQALAIDPNTPATLYAGTYADGVFKSTNSGSTWSAVTNGLTDLNIQALAINPDTPATLYAGTYAGGVFKSTNGGSTWSDVTTGLTDLNIQALAIDPNTPSALYAGTYADGVFKSTDSGASWTAINDGLTGNLRIWTIGIDPVTTSTLYAGVGDNLYQYVIDESDTSATGGCFIATLASGSYLNFSSMALRDKISALGHNFANMFYHYSPAMAGEYNTLRTTTLWTQTPAVYGSKHPRITLMLLFGFILAGGGCIFVGTMKKRKS